MEHRQLINYHFDRLVSEAATYLESFWSLKLMYLREAELADEFARGMLAEEMNEFHRRCLDNDKPGRRHMMPFYWRKDHGLDGTVTETKVPIKVGSPRYELQMGKYRARMDELKRRTPNYGRKI